MKEEQRDLIVLGGGPGGYTAAFRAADLGRDVTIIEKEPTLGGVCLNVGCIPSKTLLHAAEVMEEVRKIKEAGINFDPPKIDIEQLRNHKSKVVTGLTNGLSSLAASRKVEIIRGTGKFKSNTSIEVESSGDRKLYSFKDLIIAAGSRPVEIPGIPYGEDGIWDSTRALELESIPRRLLIIGAGIIGLEMAAVYHGLGSKITIVEAAGEIIPPCDRDLKRPLMKKIKKEYEGVFTSAKVKSVTGKEGVFTAFLEGPKAPEKIEADAVLISVGRRPNSDLIGIENTSIDMDDRGFIKVDPRQRSTTAGIFAVGDITGNPMLAHRAAGQAKIAAETACGNPAAFTPMGIPAVAYTSPEIAWVGLTENEAAEKKIDVRKAAFPWSASGRALSAQAGEGVSKILFDPKSGRVLGAGIAGKNAGELIGEAVLALEMGATAGDIGDTVHPHPTLSETFALAAEKAEGKITELLNDRS